MSLGKTPKVIDFFDLNANKIEFGIAYTIEIP